MVAQPSGKAWVCKTLIHRFKSDCRLQKQKPDQAAWFLFLVCFVKSDLNPWVRALRKQFGELFLARSGKAGTEFRRNWVAEPSTFKVKPKKVVKSDCRLQKSTNFDRSSSILLFTSSLFTKIAFRIFWKVIRTSRNKTKSKISLFRRTLLLASS